MDSTNKISFGFKKISNTPISVTKKDDNVEYIKYLDDPVTNTQNQNENENTDFNFVNKTRDLNILDDLENKNNDTLTSTNITENKTNDTNSNNDNKPIFCLPTRVTALEETTINDYNEIALDEFGEKLLHELGWTKESGIGLKRKNVNIIEHNGRSSGLGLGVDIKKKYKKLPLKVNEKLEIKKGAYVKIIAGNLIYNYGEVQGFSDTDRIIVKLVNNEHTEIIENHLEPVTLAEFKKHSKIINQRNEH